jgi:hypothetical protein
MQQNYNQMAQGLASLGRGDDSMLMHITPDEFQDFNRMAQSAGMEHIPINPMTGLPEFGFGKSFKKLTKSVTKAVSKVLKSPIVRTLAPIAIGMYAPGFLASMGTRLLVRWRHWCFDRSWNICINRRSDARIECWFRRVWWR